LTFIDWSAFEHCPVLETVDLPDSVTNLEWHAFADCPALNLSRLPDSLLQISAGLFTGCLQITELTLGRALSSFPTQAWQPTNLNRFIVSEFNPYFSHDSNGLIWSEHSTKLVLLPLGLAQTSLTLPDYGLVVGSRAFAGQSNIRAISLPAVTEIEIEAFSNCANLEEVSFGDRLRVISYGAFDYCSKLQFHAAFPDSLIEIGDYAFHGCSAMTSLSFGASLSFIGRRAFPDDLTITNSDNNENLEVVDNYLVYTKGKLALLYATKSRVPASLKLADTLLFVGSAVFESSTLKSVVLPNVIDIMGAAFANCETLESVSMPAIVYVGTSAFVGCYHLKTVQFSPVLADIDSEAFYLCTTLIFTSLPDSLSSLGASAFSSCWALAEVAFASPLQSLPEGSFSTCINLRSISLPDTVTAIGQDAFYMCDTLDTVQMPALLSVLGYRAFGSCPLVTSLRLPDFVSVLGAGCLPPGLTTLSISGNNVCLASYFFSRDLTAIHIRGPPGEAVCSLIGKFPSATLSLSGLPDSAPATICGDRAFDLAPDNHPQAPVPRSVPPSRSGGHTRSPLDTRSPFPAPPGTAPRTQTRSDPTSTRQMTNTLGEPESPIDIPSPKTMNIAPQTGTLVASRSPKQTPLLDAEPELVIVRDNAVIDLTALDPARPIAINGSGFVQGTTNEQLWLTIVNIGLEAQIVAKDLVVQSSLRLESGSKLEAAPSDMITLVPGVELEFRCGNFNQLPHLDLGVIGDGYTVLPAVLEVVIEALPSTDEVPRALVQGKTLSNCDEWRKKVTGIPNGYEVTCDTITSSGQSLLNDGPVIGLFIVKTRPVDDHGLSGGAIAGIVVGAVVVLAAAAGAVWWLMSKGVDTSEKRPSA
jgi:hypothetical protein